MANASLSATARAERGKGAARTLRRDGQVPAVIYGHAREVQSLAVNARDLGRLLEHVTGSTIIELTIDGKASRTLVREIQRHPFKRHVMHIDFQELVAGEKVTVDVPIIYRGTPIGDNDGEVVTTKPVVFFRGAMNPALTGLALTALCYAGWRWAARRDALASRPRLAWPSRSRRWDSAGDGSRRAPLRG